MLAKIILAEERGVEGSEGYPQILISEIQIGAAVAGDEFIELHNPNAFAVNLGGWSLKRKTKSGSASNLLTDIGTKIDPVTGVRDDSGTVLEIPAGGYFLIAPRYVCDTEDKRCYQGEVAPDNFYSVKEEFLADNNSLILYHGKSDVVDKVGWGEAVDIEGSTYLGDSATVKNLWRVIIEGVMADTHDNSRDFSSVGTPSPQNSLGQIVISGADEEDMDDMSDVAAEPEEGTGSETGTLANEESGGIDSSDQEDDADEAGDEEIIDQSGSGPVFKETKVSITELLASPTGDDRVAEFIELFNAGDGAADLSGWSLEDRLGKTGRYVFPAGTAMEVGKYLVLYSAVTKLSLNNSADGMILKDAVGKTVYTTPLYSEAEENMSFAEAAGSWMWSIVPTPGSKNIIRPEGAEEGKKKEDKPSGEKTEADISVPGEDSGEGTREETEPEKEKKYDFADNVTISEIFPDPVGKDNSPDHFEWVEIHNGNAREVDLEGWCLDDVPEKGSKRFCFAASTPFAADGYRVISSEETRIAFNNSAEEVNLLWPDGRVIDQVSYEKAKEGSSYSRDAGDGWTWTARVTPGAANIILASDSGAKNLSLPRGFEGAAERGKVKGEELLGEDMLAQEELPLVSVAEAKTFPAGSRLETSGIVSVPYGVLGPDILYLSDRDTGEGMQMVGSRADLSSFVLGDELRCRATVSEVGGEKRLLLEEGLVRKVSADNPLAAAPLLPEDLADLDPMVGNLVSAEGVVGEVHTGNLFFLKTASGELKVYAEPETGIVFAAEEKGRKIGVTGILSRTSAGYRLLPRFLSDIRFLENADSGIIKTNAAAATQSAPAGNSTLSFVFYLLGGGFLLLLRRYRSEGKKRFARLLGKREKLGN